MNHQLEAVILAGAWATFFVLLLCTTTDVPKWVTRLSGWALAPWFIATCMFTGWMIAAFG